MSDANLPKSFWIIGIIALIWNLIGVASFAMTVTMSPEAIAELPTDQQPFYENVPLWATAAYGIAVIFGALGCVALLMRKSVAVPLFVVSLVAVFVQFGHAFGMTNVVEVVGASSLGLPTLVTVVGAFLIWYSTSTKTKGWIG